MTTALEEPIAERGTKMTLEKLRQKCLDREARCYDDVVSLKSLHMDPKEPGRLIIQRGKGQPRESYEMLSHIYSQAPGVLYGLPGSYLKKLVTGEHGDPELAALNFNHWVNANKDREVMLRFGRTAKSGESYLRAMLPGSWNPIPYSDALELLAVKHSKDQKVLVEKFDEVKLVFNIVTRQLERKKAKRGDDVEWGMRYRDSDVGVGQLEMMPYTLTLRCTNGMTSVTGGACVRVSHSSKSSSDMNQVLAQLRQSIDMISGYAQQIAEQMDNADTVLLKEERLEAIIQRINKAHDVTRLEDRYVKEGWALEAAARPEPTVLRLANAYTRAANAEELGDDGRFRLQGVGGTIIATADQKWRWN